MHSGKGQKGQKNSFESQVAVGTVKPFTHGVGAAAIAARANGNGFTSERERDVGVGGGQAWYGLDSEMSVHGADYLEDASIGAKLARGAVSNAFDGKADFVASRLIAKRNLIPHRSHRFPQLLFKLLQLLAGCRAQINARLGAIRYRIDRSPSLNHPDIEGG